MNEPFLWSPDFQEPSFPAPLAGTLCRYLSIFETNISSKARTTCRQSAAALPRPTDVPTESWKDERIAETSQLAWKRRSSRSLSFVMRDSAWGLRPSTILLCSFRNRVWVKFLSWWWWSQWHLNGSKTRLFNSTNISCNESFRKIVGERERALGSLGKNLDVVELWVGFQSRHRNVALVFPQTHGSPPVRPVDHWAIDEGGHRVYLLTMGCCILVSDTVCVRPFKNIQGLITSSSVRRPGERDALTFNLQI